jgi:hypothetical protein
MLLQTVTIRTGALGAVGPAKDSRKGRATVAPVALRNMRLLTEGWGKDGVVTGIQGLNGSGKFSVEIERPAHR